MNTLLQARTLDLGDDEYYKLHLFSSKNGSWNTDFHPKLIRDAFVLLDEAYGWLYESESEGLSYLSQIYVKTMDDVLKFQLSVGEHLHFGYSHITDKGLYHYPSVHRWNVTKEYFIGI